MNVEEWILTFRDIFPIATRYSRPRQEMAIPGMDPIAVPCLFPIGFPIVPTVPIR